MRQGSHEGSPLQAVHPTFSLSYPDTHIWSQSVT